MVLINDGSEQQLYFFRLYFTFYILFGLFISTNKRTDIVDVYRMECFDFFCYFGKMEQQLIYLEK